MTDREIFRRNLADLMERTKTKQVDIARYAEVSYQTVSAWVRGRGYPRADAMEKLCKFFGVTQSVLTEYHKREQTPEEKLITAFRSLSDTGKKKMLERADELKILHHRRNKNAEDKEEPAE